MNPCILVIPARWASERFPGKPLARIAGRSLLSRTVAAGRAAMDGGRVLVATDDARIAAEAEAAGADRMMTSPDCANGTERVAEAVAGLGEAPGIVVNLQGDAPLTPPWFIAALVKAMNADPTIEVATPVLTATASQLARFRADRAAGRVGATTAVTDSKGRALYFSKEVLPFGADETTPVLYHVGVYAYRPTALSRFAALACGRAERAEGLEQLRFLENGIGVRCIEVEARGRDFWEVNSPGDIPLVEAILAAEDRP